MATSAINANEHIQSAIDSMAGNFQERFETFVSALKSSVSSSSRSQAEKIFLSAVPALSYKFPDPTGLASDTDEENSAQSEVDSLKAEIVNLKKQQEKLERRVQNSMKKNNKEHVEELCKVVKTNENNIKGLRKLQQVLQQKNQSPGATALPMSSYGAGATVTSKPLKALRKRTEFSVRADGDKEDPGINDVKLLPGGLLVVADGGNECLKLFNIQGKLLYCLPCNCSPICLAVVDSSSTPSSRHTLVVTLPKRQAIDILEVTDQRLQVNKSLKVNEEYSALAAVNNNTLAVGYLEEDDSRVDIISLNGQLLCRISSVPSPFSMISTKNSELIFSTWENGSIAKVNSFAGRVIFDVEVPQITVPLGVTIVSDDTLLVADYYAPSLHLVSSEGQWLKQVWTAPSTSAKDGLRSVTIESSLCVCVTNCGFAYVLDAVY
ncbi:hypothetical protein PoB_003252000 [Plakobranchus ocellatus]|uniref:Uncharacterized protein n=1 Tax=Plakobranchus ocellatus TaxID=259542 RepID=A0AAV4AGX3_9GAST|nr:hypothetical protein PoB_003252000 [Plakobranchus ocellatus]